MSFKKVFYDFGSSLKSKSVKRCRSEGARIIQRIKHLWNICVTVYAEATGTCQKMTRLIKIHAEISVEER